MIRTVSGLDMVGASSYRDTLPRETLNEQVGHPVNV